jgi:glycosyltransferase involved in cell wall biosynthesis
MRIIIATSVAPFVEGGSTQIVTWLHRQLQVYGHEVELFQLPFSESCPEILDQLLALRLLDLSEHGDRLIAVRTPSHLLKHPNKVAWFIHHFRSAYDLWGTKYQTLPNTPEGVAYRSAIVNSDNVALKECTRLFCNSLVFKERLRRFNRIEAEVLYPPLLDPAHFHTGPYGDCLLYFSRLTHHKRQWLAIEALQHTRTPVKLIIAGCPDPGSEPYVVDLHRMVEKYGLGDRVSILSRWVAEDEKVELFAECLAVVYFPLDEDSYGYPSLEAHAAHKAVLTTQDAGGTNELVVDGDNGFVRPADAELIAEAMDALYNDRAAAQRMGEAGEQRVRELGVNWDHVIGRLLA